GRAKIPRAVLRLLPKKSNLLALGEVSEDVQEKAVRGRLMFNTLTGTDKGAQSAKVLGSDRRLGGGGMWQSERQTGVVILTAPSSEILKRLDASVEEE